VCHGWGVACARVPALYARRLPPSPQHSHTPAEHCVAPDSEPSTNYSRRAAIGADPTRAEVSAIGAYARVYVSSIPISMSRGLAAVSTAHSGREATAISHSDRGTPSSGHHHSS
jgi:hypothetical protein